MDKEEIKSSGASLAEICCKNYYSLEYQNDAKINCDHLLVPLFCDDGFAGVLRRRGPHRNLEIGNVAVGEGFPPVLIAEIGVNHDGDMAKARLLIDQAKKAKADFVKFQHRSLVDTYIGFEGNNASELSTESTLDHLRKVNLSIEQLNELFEYARNVGIPPLCTPFDLVSLGEVLSLDPVALKIASADLLNFDLIEAAAKTHLPLILSTGMHTEDEIIAAVNFVRLHTADFIILHCVSSYPAESSSLNLIYIQRLKELCGCIVGYSSHDNGNLASLSSVALGAAVVEKHLTWSRQAEGPDHNASIEFPELQSLSKQIKDVYASVGNLKAEGKKLSQGELMNRANLSKGLYATRLIKAGEVLTNGDLICRSPGIGIPCSSKKFALGRPVLRKIKKFEPVYESDIFPKNVDWDRLQNIPINSTWGSCSV